MRRSEDNGPGIGPYLIIGALLLVLVIVIITLFLFLRSKAENDRVVDEGSNEGPLPLAEQDKDPGPPGERLIDTKKKEE